MSGDDDLLVVTIEGGFQDDHDGPETVGTPGSAFHVVRGSDETRAEFGERVKAEARAAGVTGVLVVGGFCDD